MRGGGVHRVSGPWLKLLSAVGVIPTLILDDEEGEVLRSALKKRQPIPNEDTALTRCTPAPDHSEKTSIGEETEGRACTPA